MDPTDAAGESPSQQVTAETLKVVAALISQTGEAHYIPLRGNSMLPLLHDGDQILVTSCLDEVQMGEVVVFQRDHDWLAHRVLRVEKDRTNILRLITKGDHVMRPDVALKPDSLVGRVLEVRRGGWRMHLDTRSWRMVNKYLAKLMLNEVWFFEKAAGKTSSKRENQWWVQTIAYGILLLNSFLLRSIQFVIGRWES